MSGTWKITPWVLLVTGLVWLVSVLLRFRETNLAGLQLCIGALCVVVGVGGLRGAARRTASQSERRPPNTR